MGGICQRGSPTPTHAEYVAIACKSQPLENRSLAGSPHIVPKRLHKPFPIAAPHYRHVYIFACLFIDIVILLHMENHTWFCMWARRYVAMYVCRYTGECSLHSFCLFSYSSCRRLSFAKLTPPLPTLRALPDWIGRTSAPHTSGAELPPSGAPCSLRGLRASGVPSHGLLE